MNLRLLALFLMVAFLTSCNSVQKNKEEKKTLSPNIVYILVDDMGYGDLSLYGQETLSTPKIDKMAHEGIHFTNHYTGSTVCGPSRACLLTGKHTGSASVRGNEEGQLLKDDEATLPKILKKAGYTTGLVGKWGVGHPPEPNDPLRCGFDYSYGYVNMWHAHNFFPEFMYRNGEKVALDNKLKVNENGENPWADMPEGTGVAQVKEEYAHDLFDQEALSFIEKNKDNKFFLYLAYNVPHANNEKKPDGMEVKDYGEFAAKDWPSQEKGFAKMIRNIDNSVDMVLSKLKDLGIDENTLVIFASDNGPHQEGGHIMEFFNSNGELKGSKRDLYEGGVRTPFIAWWPGTIEPNTTSEHISAFWDVLPTFCDLTGVEKPENTDGISFLPALLGNEEKQDKHEFLYWEFYEGGGKQAVLMDNWKGCHLKLQKPEETVFELYDLNVDPAETNNVAQEHPEIVEKMKAVMQKEHSQWDLVPLHSEIEEGQAIMYGTDHHE